MARTSRVWTAAALGAAVLVLAGCDSGASSTPTTTGTGTSTASPSPAYSSDTSLEPPPATGVIDVPGLAAGAPPEATYLAGGQLHWRGRTVPTDFPTDVYYPQILGAAGGRLVVTGYQTGGSEEATRFWAVDPNGHAERLGRGYEAEQYAPALVVSTGHLFIYNADRTTPWTIREVDARTGRELATYDEDRVPQGLARDDQTLVDAWLKGRSLEDYREDRTRDGSMNVRARSVVAGTGTVVTHVNVVRADGEKLARFSFDTTTEDSSFDGVRFEDRDHVLVLLTLSSSRRGGDQQVVVRCAVAEQTCEHATPVGGAIALGVYRPVVTQPKS